MKKDNMFTAMIIIMTVAIVVITIILVFKDMIWP